MPEFAMVSEKDVGHWLFLCTFSSFVCMENSVISNENRKLNNLWKVI